ncbi:PEP-CTERM sorting domain-containing protein [Poriferisphaera sp. WC338]|uniref:PEP-CTERM sorting domain-containing protein n=1 Tax=Poriferisphaera sp. WC338 TaxID=3425129 RepID=UPI003D816BE8
MLKQRGRVLTAAVVAVSGAVIATSNSEAAFSRTVMLRGEQAADLPVGVTYRGSAASITINQSGQVAFVDSLIGPGVDSNNDIAMFSEGSGTLKLVAREGSDAPGANPGDAFWTLNGHISDTGDVAIRSRLKGAGIHDVNDWGMWSGNAGTLSKVIREGDQAPELSGGTLIDGIFFNDGLPLLNNAGHTAFFATLTGTGVSSANDRGVWTDANGSLSLVARKGDGAPGTPTGVNFSHFSGLVMNDADQVAFRGTLSGAGVNSDNQLGLWIGDSNSLTKIIRTGEAAPGTVPGTKFDSLGSFAINDTGQSSFFGRLGLGGVINTANDTGIWTNSNGSLSSVVLEGEVATGAGPDAFFKTFSAINLGNTGHTTFFATLDGAGIDSTNDQSIWIENAGTLTMLAHEGDAAPGHDPGIVFGNFSSVISNKAGQVVFTAFMDGPGITGTNSLSIWTADTNGQLSQLLQTGDLFDVDDDLLAEELRTVSSFQYMTNSYTGRGHGTAFNDVGELAVRINFDDGSTGVFVLDTNAIPEPASLALLSISGLALLSRRRSPSA